MEQYLRAPIQVPIDALYPDPNNPRLAIEEMPGYEDSDALFAEELREMIFGELGDNAHNVDDLVRAIEGQGWMPIDSIIVWPHPESPDRYVVVEGNRRRLALERIRTSEVTKAREKLARMTKRGSNTPKQQIEEQEKLLTHLEQIVKDTQDLTVLPINADSPAELEIKLPRVLAVRHITGAKEWGNYAEDLWLLNRYHQLFAEKHDGADVFWDQGLINHVADEASLTATKLKRQLKASSWYSHFRNEWEGELPEGEEFKPSDYYLFELISKYPFVRQALEIAEHDLRIPYDSEKVLFEWVFKLERPARADDNENVFYRHENIRLWDQMKKYDDKNSTAFAARFDPSSPDEAPRMHEVEAEWLGHKARRKPHAVIDELLRRLSELTAESLALEGEALRIQLERLNDQSSRFLKMIKAAGD